MFGTVCFYYFSIRCLCIEELENPSVNFLFARRSFSRPSHSRPFNLLCDWTSQFLIASACRHVTLSLLNLPSGCYISMKYTYCVPTEHVKLTRELTRAQHHKLNKGKY